MRTTPRVILILKQASLATRRCEIRAKKIAVTVVTMVNYLKIFEQRWTNFSERQNQRWATLTFLNNGWNFSVYFSIFSKCFNVPKFQHIDFWFPARIVKSIQHWKLVVQSSYVSSITGKVAELIWLNSLEITFPLVVWIFQIFQNLLENLSFCSHFVENWEKIKLFKHPECSFNGHFMRFHHIQTMLSHFAVLIYMFRYQRWFRDNQRCSSPKTQCFRA